MEIKKDNISKEILENLGKDQGKLMVEYIYYTSIDEKPYEIGYCIKNISNSSISYKNELFSIDENGDYVSDGIKDYVLEPNETINLNRRNTAILAGQIEFLAKFANGVVVCENESDITNDNFDRMLNNYHFEFYDKNEKKKPSIKIMISEEIDGVLRVKPGYLKTFGYLNGRIVNESIALEKQKRAQELIKEQTKNNDYDDNKELTPKEIKIDAKNWKPEKQKKLVEDNQKIVTSFNQPTKTKIKPKHNFTVPNDLAIDMLRKDKKKKIAIKQKTINKLKEETKKKK